MKKYKNSFSCLLVIFIFLLIISCSNAPDIVGEWREIGKTATVVFWKDGTFRAIDNQGMEVSGTYTLNENGEIRFEIDRQGFVSDVVVGTISMEQDELILISDDGSEVDRYRKEK